MHLHALGLVMYQHFGGVWWLTLQKPAYDSRERVGYLVLQLEHLRSKRQPGQTLPDGTVRYVMH